MAEPVSLSPTRIWDLPTRLFHWALAVVVCAALASGWIGEGALVWHMRCGLAVAALLLFRVLWGLVGGRWSRFSSFLYGPAALRRYLRGEVRAGDRFEVGHNPLGSLSVFGLLGILAVQVGTGLVADDEVATQGPLNRYVSSALGLRATGWHHGPGQWIVAGLVLLHVMAIIFYRLRKQTDLVRPMLAGDKPLPVGTPASADSAATRTLALLLGVACAALATWVGRLGG